MKDRSGALVPGGILILLGLFFLARQLNLPLPGLGQLWPGLVVLGGALSLAGYAFSQRRDSEQVFAGVMATLAGAFFFLFTLRLPLPVPSLEDGVEWADMARLWPMFVLFAALAFLAQWLAQPDRTRPRNLGAAALLVGLVALALNFSGEQDWLRRVARLWPALLILAGLRRLLYMRRQGPDIDR